MGFVMSSIRLLYLTQLKNDLEHKMMLHTEAKMDLSREITDLTGVGTTLTPDNPMVQGMKVKRDKLKLVEQEMDKELEELKMKLQAVNQEIQEARGLVKDNVASSFSYGQGR